MTADEHFGNLRMEMVSPNPSSTYNHGKVIARGCRVTALILAPPLVIFGLGYLLSTIFGERFPLQWWLIRLGLVPIIFLSLALYVLSFPTPVPENYNPNIHGNPGRGDFAAILAWGLLAPIVYLTIALPTSIAYAIWRRFRDKRQSR
jgi:hypothetical protein